MPEHQELRSIHYPTLAGGMRFRAEPRTLTPQTPPHYFRNMLNLVPRDGLLRRREALNIGASVFDLGGAVVRNSTGNGQYPQAIFDLSLWPQVNGFRAIVVTDKELWIVTTAGAFNITPTYATGTVGVTNGSPTITGGGGQLWKTRNVGDDNLILIDTDAAWNILDTVAGEDQGTLATNFAGTTGARTYTVRRGFWGLKLAAANAHYPWYGAHGAIILDSFYLAGMFGRYNTTGDVYAPTGAVLKIDGAADPTKTTFSAADVTYLFSSQDMDGGTMGVADRFFAPLGLEVHEDGRLIMPAHMGEDGSGEPAGSARVWWSSPSDYTEWTLAPAGSADQVQRRTMMTGVGKMGRAFAFHFNDQILLASPTGASNPPLSYLNSRAQVGAAGPRLRLGIGGGTACPAGDFFVAADGNCYVFNGDNAIPVDTGWRPILGSYAWSNYLVAGRTQLAFLGYDSFRREISLFFPETTSASYERATIELRWHIDSGTTTQHRYAVPITAISAPVYIDFTGLFGNLEDITKQVGVPSYGNSTASTMLMTLRASKLADAAPALVAAETPGSCWFELDDLDLGEPRYATLLLWVVVWLYGRTAGTESLLCKISRDEGVTFETQTKSLTLVNAQEQVVAFGFANTNGPGLKWKVRIQSNDTDTFSMGLRAISVYGVPVYDVRAG